MKSLFGIFDFFPRAGDSSLHSGSLTIVQCELSGIVTRTETGPLLITACAKNPLHYSVNCLGMNNSKSVTHANPEGSKGIPLEDGFARRRVAK